MSERYATCIRIGGEIRRNRLPELLEAIRAASVSHEWGEPPFVAQSAQELATVIRDGHLFLCDDQTRYGEFPELETTCRKLGLPYTRWCEGFCEYDAEVVDWRPGMKKPLVRIGSNSGDQTYVAAKDVRKSLRHLDAGRLTKAKKLLRALCPDIPELPLFRIV